MREVSRNLQLPIPPPEMRWLVGGVGLEHFDNPSHGPVYSYLPQSAYRSVFDFGCGCGRVARQLLLQHPRPDRYLGVDVHRGMISWCQRNLTPVEPSFEFQHHDVYFPEFNPAGTARMLELPGDEGSFTLFNALSVFTHLVQDQAQHYLKEAARLLSPDGYMNTSWFLFDKVDFPMLQSFENALFISDITPTNAVIFDRQWLRDTTNEAGLRIVDVHPPGIRGHQWAIVMRHRSTGDPEVDLPPDEAPTGLSRVPLVPADVEQTEAETADSPAPETTDR